MQQQEVFKSPSNTTLSLQQVNNTQNLDQLENDYYLIVKNVTESTIHEIMESALETFETIHQLQLSGRDDCRTSANDFKQTLKKQLSQSSKELLAAVRPSLEQVQNKNLNQDELNQHMSHQLGVTVLNPAETAHRIIAEVYVHHNKGTQSTVWKIFRMLVDKQWTDMLQHEANESSALQAWLSSWLTDIEVVMKVEFDNRLH
ncbi:hypothetical protein A0J61_04577 [Choanephora cucurbitarum]|uniref:Uncharacterized protein n=1 Tax=Choanephora cucurbitarum TaxID=101091 RepID=A0A1C7NE49_9FUNG|nr:hypothetical protein A0J61_04577 [Choanephora cucurbitarum]